jgi:hypothetical protein
MIRSELHALGSHLAKGYSRHLGGPYYVVSNPDTGRLSFAIDNGRGTTPIPRSHVPDHVIDRHLSRRHFV